MAKKKSSKKKAGDISKQVYKFQEGITAIALEKLGIPEAEIHWPTSCRPKGVSVDVDVLIGSSQETAHTNIGLKHVAAVKDGTHAAWRMMRELLDTKANGAPNFRIYSVVFDDAINTDWGTILSRFYDGHLSLPSRSKYGPALIETAFNYTRGILNGKSDPECRDILRAACDSSSLKYDQGLADLMRLYSIDLKRLLETHQAGPDSLWPDLRATCAREIPKIAPRVTSFRRGMAKLLILRPEDRKTVYDAGLGRNVITEELDSFLVDLSIITEEIDGYQLYDEDIVRLFDLFHDRSGNFFESILLDAPIDKINDKFVTPLRGVRNVSAYYEYLEDNLEQLMQADVMKSALIECFSNPDQLLRNYSTEGRETTVWLFNVLVAVMKSVGGTRQSSGLSALAELTGIKRISDGGFLVAPFVYRKKIMPDDVMEKVAEVFANSLVQIGINGLQELEGLAKDNFIRSIVEARLIPYKGFDPLGTLFKKALKLSGITYLQHARFKTGAAEYADTPSGARVKVLEVFSNPPAFVLWQAPNRNARDKAKEFSAIVASLSCTWSEGVFRSRGHRVCMVIDGVWDQEDIDSLLRFGCEHVYYPDEINQLVATLKSGRKMPTAEADLPIAAEGNDPPKLKRKGGNG